MTLVFVAKETGSGETRVAATPETVRAFVKAGLEVAIETDAGLASGFTDADYTAVGARVEGPAGRQQADLVLCIEPPDESTVAELKSGAVLVCSLQPHEQVSLVRALAEAKVTTFAMELIPRITRAQKMDVLSSQATCAGYQAVLMAAVALPSFFPLLMTAAGTIKPARVFIIGAGVAGLQAVATAKRLGAVVEANDVRPAVKEQVESLGARFVDTGSPPEAETAGGYAKEATDEYLRKQQEILEKHISESDVVITTALVPGKKAPRIVTAEMVARMRPGSVIVDLAVAAGGNVAGSVAGETVVQNGVKIIGEPNLPALVAADASRMWARNVLGFVDLMIDEGRLQPDWEDEIIDACCVTHDGVVRGEDVKEAAAGGAS